MNDLISILSEIRSQYNCFDPNDEPYYHALSEAIELASAQPEQKWTPVSERPPETDDFCLVTMVDTEFEQEPYLKKLFFREGCWWEFTDDGDVVEACNEKIYVTAWQPLPEPYKEEE